MIRREKKVKVENQREESERKNQREKSIKQKTKVAQALDGATGRRTFIPSFLGRTQVNYVDQREPRIMSSKKQHQH